MQLWFAAQDSLMTVANVRFFTIFAAGALCRLAARDPVDHRLLGLLPRHRAAARPVRARKPLSAIGYRAFNAALGLILTFLIYVAIRLFAREGSIRRMAIVAAVAALPAAVIMSAASLRMATWSDPMGEHVEDHDAGRRRDRPARPECPHHQAGDGDELEVNLPPIEEIIASKMPRLIADGTVTWYFLLAAWCAFFIAMTQQHRTRITELRLAEAETAAHAAQVRALRYQVNPHFLFNTLNSLSSLVMSGRSDRAEEMLMALSTFFRTSLSMDPSADVSLAEEIALQRLYLDIEKVRFPDRLEVNIDIPEDLEQARVPALILQPLVENAIKYGVSATTARVELSIRAPPPGRRPDAARRDQPGRRRTDRRKAAVADPRGHRPGPGQRLRSGSKPISASGPIVRFGPIPGGYEVSLAMPVDEDD